MWNFFFWCIECPCRAPTPLGQNTPNLACMLTVLKLVVSGSNISTWFCPVGAELQNLTVAKLEQRGKTFTHCSCRWHVKFWCFSQSLAPMKMSVVKEFRSVTGNQWLKPVSWSFFPRSWEHAWDFCLIISAANQRVSYHRILGHSIMKLCVHAQNSSRVSWKERTLEARISAWCENPLTQKALTKLVVVFCQDCVKA